MPYQPTRSQLHVDAPLTQMSIAYWQSQANFIASRVFPNVPVAKQTDRYYTFDRKWFNRNQMQKRADGTRAKMTSYEVDNTPTYSCDVFALAHPISDRQRINNDGAVNLDRNGTQLLTLAGLIHRENAFVENYFTAGVWTNEHQGVSASVDGNEFLQWNDAASTPIEDVRLRRRTIALTGFEANTLVLGRAVYDALLDHPDIIDRIKYGQTPGAPAIANLNILAQLFEVQRVLVANAVQNTAAEGQANVDAFIAGKHALLCYANPSPAKEMPSAGYTFSWNGLVPGQGIESQVMSRFRDDLAETDILQIQTAWDMKKTGDDLAIFMRDAVA